MRLSEHNYRTISSIRGPLLFADRITAARISEVVRIAYPDGVMTREAGKSVRCPEQDDVNPGRFSAFNRLVLTGKGKSP